MGVSRLRRVPSRSRTAIAAAVVVAMAASWWAGSVTGPGVANSAEAGAGADECARPPRPAAPPPGFVRRHATVDGVGLNYVTGGRGGDVVVLLHGWPESWYEWSAVMPALAREHTVVAVDLPGLGDSRGTPPDYAKKTLAGYVHGLVTSRYPGRRVHVAGHDFGAGVAFAYAGFSGGAASVTVMDFPISGPTVDDTALRGQLWWFGFHDVAQLPEDLVAGRQRTYLSWFFDHGTAPGGSIEPAAIAEYVRTYCRPDVLHGGFELYRTRPADKADNTTLTEPGRRITAPILSLAALQSPDPDAQRAQMIAQLRPMADGPIVAEPLADTGHYLPEEQPAAVARHLLDFIAAH